MNDVIKIFTDISLIECIDVRKNGPKPFILELREHKRAYRDF